MVGIDNRLGPAFDSNILTRPTRRKLAGCWMESAGVPTLVLPQVWKELTKETDGIQGHHAMSVEAWHGVRRAQDAPFRWIELDSSQLQLAHEIRASFTEACFPRVPCDRIHTHADAIITSQAIALGTDALVTGDIRTIDHYEINDLVARRWGSNRGFVLTFDDAITTAHAGAQSAQHLLVTALATIAPSDSRSWSVDEAHEELTTLCDALRRSDAPMVAGHLENRWWCASDLGSVVEQALDFATTSRFMQIERQRAQWHRQGAVTSPVSSASSSSQ